MAVAMATAAGDSEDECDGKGGNEVTARVAVMAITLGEQGQHRGVTGKFDGRGQGRQKGGSEGGRKGVRDGASDGQQQEQPRLRWVDATG